MANEIIKKTARINGVYLWELAARLGINDGNLSRKLRFEFSDSERKKVIAIIEEIASEKEAMDA